MAKRYDYMQKPLNAIETARQFAILLMDLYRREGVEFRSYDEFMTAGESDRAYYAQVADGDEWRVPRGKGDILLSAMALKSAVQLRQFRALLRLPDLCWQIADDLNWQEGVIRKMMNRASDDDELIRIMAKTALQEGYTVTQVTVSELSSETSTPPRTRIDKVEKNVSAIRRLALSKRNKASKDETLKTITMLEDLLNDLKRNLDN